MTNAQLPVAQLWIGPTNTTHQQVLRYVQELFCQHNGCNMCAICAAISSRNYYSLLWIQPHERYVLDDFIPLMESLTFELETHEKRIIIIDRADLLSSACGNSLLKTLEEPPYGYHFVLLAHNHDRVLPTIRSRCITTVLQGTPSYSDHPLLKAFMQDQPIAAITFMKLIDSHKTTEQETTDLLQQLLCYYLEQTKSHCIQKKEGYAAIAQRLTILKRVCAQPVMTGSSKLVWRELFLQFFTQKS